MGLVRGHTQFLLFQLVHIAWNSYIFGPEKNHENKIDSIIYWFRPFLTEERGSQFQLLLYLTFHCFIWSIPWGRNWNPVSLPPKWNCFDWKHQVLPSPRPSTTHLKLPNSFWLEQSPRWKEIWAWNPSSWGENLTLVSHILDKCSNYWATRWEGAEITTNSVVQRRAKRAQ